MRQFALGLILLAAPLQAQTLEEQARAAHAQLEAAAGFLASAEGRKQRIEALTEAVRAYETGLAALRESLRQASVRKIELESQLDGRNARVQALAAALLALEPGQYPQAFLHPQGPSAAARAGLLLADLTAALDSEAEQLRIDLADAKTIVSLQQNAEATLETGMLQVQAARLALHKAAAQRTDLPYRFIADVEKVAGLVASVDTLEAFASELASFATDDLGWDPPDLQARIGTLELPASGPVIRRPGEADDAGIARDGILVATQPGALVTSPVAATLRYVGPLLDLGQVIILEPQTEVLFILAGLDLTYGEAGQVVQEGAPLGIMRGLEADFLENTSTAGERGGIPQSDALYIEVRQDNVPQDPLEWFRIDKDG